MKRSQVVVLEDSLGIHLVSWIAMDPVRDGWRHWCNTTLTTRSSTHLSELTLPANQKSINSVLEGRWWCWRWISGDQGVRLSIGRVINRPCIRRGAVIQSALRAFIGGEVTNSTM